MGVGRRVVSGVARGAAWGVGLGAVGGVELAVIGGVALAVVGGVTELVIGGILGRVIGGVAIGVAWSVAIGVVGGVARGVAGGVVCFLTVSRWFYLPLMITPFFTNNNAKRLPTHWDENIFIPMPFLKKVLLRVFTYDRVGAIQEALFLVRERPPQRKAAQRALVEIAVNEMAGFRNLENIANLREELEFLPSQDERFPIITSRSKKKSSVYPKMPTLSGRKITLHPACHARTA